MGTFTDATVVDMTNTVGWASSDETKATISNAAGSRGLTAVAVGPTEIRATSGAVSAATTLTVTAAELVSIGVTPAAPTVAKGRTQQFTATGVFTDATTQDLTATVTWSSTAPAVATVSNAAGSRGLATTLAIGATDVVATSGAIHGQTTLTVAPRRWCDRRDPGRADGVERRDLSLTATGRFSTPHRPDQTATWASGSWPPSNAPGLRGVVHSVAAGTNHITATSGAIVGSVDPSQRRRPRVDRADGRSVGRRRPHQPFTARPVLGQHHRRHHRPGHLGSSDRRSPRSATPRLVRRRLARPGSVDITATIGALTATT
jgi:hypothetical protein